MFHSVYRTMFGFRNRRILAKKIFTLPVLLRPDRPRDESAAAIGTHVKQQMLDTMCAERAFKTANPRLGGIRRQWHVAVFAGGAEF